MLAPPQLTNTKSGKSNKGNSGFSLPFELDNESQAENEKKDSPPNIQAKLKINSPGDEFEQEADSFADNVMRKKAPQAIMRKCDKCGKEHEIERKEDPEKEESEEGESETGIMRKCAACSAEDDDTNKIQRTSNNKDGEQTETNSTFDSTLNSTKSGGDAMDDNTRSEMDTRFGADFSNVKIHNDSTSEQLNNEVNAQAFTHGNHVYFNQGKYSPGSEEGKQLLAHELAHTVQQGAVEQNIPPQSENAEPADTAQSTTNNNSATDNTSDTSQVTTNGTSPTSSESSSPATTKPPVKTKEGQSLPADTLKVIKEAAKKSQETESVVKEDEKPANDGATTKQEGEEEEPSEEKPLTLEETIEQSVATLQERSTTSAALLAPPVMLNTNKTGSTADQIEEDIAEARANSITESSVFKIQALAQKGIDTIPQLQELALNRKAGVMAHLEGQIALNQAHNEELQLKTKTETGAAMALVSGKYNSAVSQVKSKQKLEKDALKVSYDASTSMLSTKKIAQLAKIKTDLENGRKLILGQGLLKAYEAYSESIALYRTTLSQMPADVSDGVMDGNLKYRRAKARLDVILPIGEQYRDTLVTNAYKQSAQILCPALEESYNRQIEDASTTTQDTFDQVYQSSIDAIDTEANTAIGKLRTGYNMAIQVLHDTQNRSLEVLKMQQQVQQDALRQQAEMHLTNIDSFVTAQINAVTSGITEAIGGLEGVILDFKNTVNAFTQLPPKEELTAAFDETNALIDSSYTETMSGLEGCVTTFTETLEGTCTGIETVFTDLATGFSTEQTTEQDTVQPLLDEIKTGYSESAKEIVSSSSKNIKALSKPAFDTYKDAENKINTAFGEVNTTIATKITTSLKTVKDQFDQIIHGPTPTPGGPTGGEQEPDPCPPQQEESNGEGGEAESTYMTKQIKDEGDKKAAEEQPRWKKIAKIALFVVVIVGSIALAIVTGGASLTLSGVLIGAMIGAGSAAILSIGTQMIDNGSLDLTKVDWKQVGIEALIGGVTGALSIIGADKAAKLLGPLFTKAVASVGTRLLVKNIQTLAPIIAREAGEMIGDAVIGALADGGIRLLFGQDVSAMDLLKGALFGIGLGIALKGSMFGLGKLRAKMSSGRPRVDANIDAPRAAGDSPQTHADGTPGPARADADAQNANRPPQNNADTPEAIGKRMSNDEGVVNRVETEDGHTIKTDEDGNIVKCSKCKLFEVSHMGELNANPDLADELKQLRSKMKADPNADWTDELIAIERKLNSARPAAEPGYHWKTLKNGEKVYSKNPGNGGPQRVFDPETRTFKDKAITDPALQRTGLPEPGTEAHTRWSEYELRRGQQGKLPCFLKGTLIKTPMGDKKIEDMKVGDEIYTQDSISNKIVVGNVTVLHRNWTHTVVKVKLENNIVIEATNKHPFWVIDFDEWLPAGNLQTGWTLWNINGDNVKVKSIEKEERIADTYNFEVIPHHMYFVSENGILVHNDDGVSKYLDTNRSNGTIYTISDRTGKVIYVGQTIEGFDTRFDHHLKDPKSAVYQYLETHHPDLMTNGRFNKADISDVLSTRTPIENKPLTPFELSVWEQHYINEHGPIGKEGGPLENKINAITDDKYDIYRELHNPCD